MGVPLLGSIRDLVNARAERAKVQGAAALLTGLLCLAAAALVCAAGLVALSDALGFPVAALIVAALLSGLALGIALVARRYASAKQAQAAEAQSRIQQELAIASALTQSARPLLPLVAFIAVFLFARRP